MSPQKILKQFPEVDRWLDSDFQFLFKKLNIQQIILVDTGYSRVLKKGDSYTIEIAVDDPIGLTAVLMHELLHVSSRRNGNSHSAEEEVAVEYLVQRYCFGKSRSKAMDTALKWWRQVENDYKVLPLNQKQIWKMVTAIRRSRWTKLIRQVFNKTGGGNGTG